MKKVTGQGVGYGAGRARTMGLTIIYIAIDEIADICSYSRLLKLIKQRKA